MPITGTTRRGRPDVFAASLAFAIPNAAPGIRAASMALSGFFSAAVVTTRLVDIVYLIGLLLVYWAVMRDEDRRFRLRRIALDVAWYTAGIVTLLVYGGIFATKRHDAEFLFFMPQVRVALSTSGEGNQILSMSGSLRSPISSYRSSQQSSVSSCSRAAARAAGEYARLLMAATAWSVSLSCSSPSGSLRGPVGSSGSRTTSFAVGAVDLLSQRLRVGGTWANAATSLAEPHRDWTRNGRSYWSAALDLWP